MDYPQIKYRMKFILFLFLLLCCTTAFSQRPETSLKTIKQDTAHEFTPIKFNGKLYGFIMGTVVDQTGSYGQDEDSKLYKSSKTIIKIKLFIPLNQQQTAFLEDSIKRSILKKNNDTYVFFDYTKDYYNEVEASNSVIPITDAKSAAAYLKESGKLRNGLLTFGMASVFVSGGIILLGSPIAGEIIAAVCGIVIIVEEYRANNLLIKASDKMLMK